MADQLSITNAKKNEAYVFYVTLTTSGDLDTPVNTPTLAGGDVKVTTDGAAIANIATLPVVTPASSVSVKVVLSASEMNGDNVLVIFEDQTGTEEWEALSILIKTYAVDQDDIVRSTTPANTLDVSSGGEAGLDWANIGGKTTTHAFTNTTVGVVTVLTGHTVQTGDSYARLAAPSGASVSADIAALKAETVLIVADTGELQGDWTNGGRLDLLLDAIVADVASLDDTKIPNTLSLANINTEIDNALNTAIPGAPTADSINQRIRSMDLLTEASGSGDLAAILVDTGVLQTDWANGGRLDLLIDAILADTGTDGVVIKLTQTYTEGQSARTVGAALELAEAGQSNRIVDTGVGGKRTIYQSDSSTKLTERDHSATELTP